MGRISSLTELTSLASNDYLIVLDSSANIAKKITVANAFGIPDFGWTASGESWTFNAWNSTSKIGVINVPSNATLKYTVGNFIRISQSTGGTKYGKILSITSTTLTVWMPGYTLNNETISSPNYSPHATPSLIPITISEGNPYRFLAQISADYAISASTKVAFNSAVFDTTSNFNTSTNRFIAPVDGYYSFAAQVHISYAGGQYNQLQFMKNGSAHVQGNLS